MKSKSSLASSLGRSARAVACGLLSLSATLALAEINVPSNGTSGQLNVTANTELDLSQCPTGVWNQNCAVGNGVYDPAKWAVVYHWTAVNVAAGATLTFKNHPSGAPVVFLVQGNVTMDGTIDASAKPVVLGEFGIPGPGGFRGGMGRSGTHGGTGGFGPGAAYGGGGGSGNSGSYGTQGQNQSLGSFRQVYGNARIVPMIGGSGGAGDPNNYFLGLSGGGGGGGILLASRNTVTINGSIFANGAFGGVHQNFSYGGDGSGGAIRIIADTVSGAATGKTEAISKDRNGNNGRGGDGRIRFEYNSASYFGTTKPVPSSAILSADPVIWPESSAPVCRILSIDGQTPPGDPSGSLTTFDVTISKAYVETFVECQNVPVDGSWNVYIRHFDRALTYNNSYQLNLVGGNATLSTWKVSLNYYGNSVIQPVAQKQ